MMNENDKFNLKIALDQLESITKRVSQTKVGKRYSYLKDRVNVLIKKPDDVNNEKEMKEFARKHLNREDMLDELHRINLYISGGWSGYFVGDEFHLHPKTIQKGNHIYQDSGSRTGLKPYFRSSGTNEEDWLLSVANYFLKYYK